jgi:hypothetical protein
MASEERQRHAKATMKTLSTGIVCRICGRTIEPDITTTYVTCILCREPAPERELLASSVASSATGT